MDHYLAWNGPMALEWTLESEMSFHPELGRFSPEMGSLRLEMHPSGLIFFNKASLIGFLPKNRPNRLTFGSGARAGPLKCMTPLRRSIVFASNASCDSYLTPFVS